VTISYIIKTKQLDGQVQATVREIDATVTAPTVHDALGEACLAIHLAMVEEHKKQKRRKRGKDRTA